MSTGEITIVGPPLSSLDAELAFQQEAVARSKDARKQAQMNAAGQEARGMLGKPSHTVEASCTTTVPESSTAQSNARRKSRVRRTAIPASGIHVSNLSGQTGLAQLYEPGAVSTAVL